MKDNFDLFDVTLSTIITLYIPYLVNLVIQAIDAGGEWYTFLLNNGNDSPLIPLFVMLGIRLVWRSVGSEDNNDERSKQE